MQETFENVTHSRDS